MLIRFLLLVTFVGIASSCLAQDQDPPYGYSNHEWLTRQCSGWYNCQPLCQFLLVEVECHCINNTATPISDGLGSNIWLG